MWSETFGQVGTHDEAFGQQLGVLRWVATAGANVLIRGETGTGKEVLARSVHEQSGRSGAFVAVNCAAISPQLLGSELFGHVPGAFTGAERRRAGAVVASEGGTLFLDEIADAPVHVQVALLRALDHGRVKPVGADHEAVVDLRVIAATSRDLESLIAEDRFRKDLYYRLQAFEITVPPLRERSADLPDLVRHLLRELTSPSDGLELSAEGLRFVQEQPLHGNVRELRNLLQTAAALCPAGSQIGRLELSAAMGRRPTAHDRGVSGDCPFELSPVPDGSRLPDLDLSPVPDGSLLDEEPISLARRVPHDVRARALAWHRSGKLILPEGLTRRKTRAEERLQLIFLIETRGYLGLSPELQQRARRLFAPGWQSVDNGAAGRHVAARLGSNFGQFQFEV